MNAAKSIATGSLAVVGCMVLSSLAVQPSTPGREPAVPTKPGRSASEDALHLDPADVAGVERLLLKIAAEYTSYERVSDRANWAPTLCRVPTPSSRGGVLSSASKDVDSHGKKLYFLYASDGPSYASVGNCDSSLDHQSITTKPCSNPVGQIVVKESFKPEEVLDIGSLQFVPNADTGQIRDLAPHFTREGNRFFKTGQPSGLFIMVKLVPSHASTDDGWIYATTSPDGKSITSSGVIASCVECHRETTRDRLYGPRWSWPEVNSERVPPTHENVAAEARARGAMPSIGR